MKSLLSTFLFAALVHAASASAQVQLFPANNATDVNPDTRLTLTFASPPALQNKGKVRVYDAANDSLVDELDMSIPPGPRNTRTPAPYDTFHYSSVPDTVFTVNNPDTDASHVYQQTYIAGTGDDSARHFFPILVEGNTATVSLHHNKLAYAKRYYVQIDADVLSFAGISGKDGWMFSTKPAAPAADKNPVVVAADGTADFSSVQGALDWVPENNTTPKEIYIKNGIYEEIAVLRNKQNLTLHGEDREKVVVRYANNGVFNRVGRYEFTVTGSNAVNLVNFTIQSVGKDENPAQAEALLVRGDKYQAHNLTLLGSGDALQIQTETRIFLSRTSIRGYGDNLLSYGAAFFKRCDLISTYGPHGWPRNPQTNHGDVFVESTFSLEGMGTSGDGHCTLARSPTSGVSFPYAEFVLINCKLQGIAPEGWGDAGPDYSNVHFWEFNSVNLSDGKPVDVSRRVSYSRQLTMEKDAEIIANYSDPTYVLGGWTPELAPIILTQLPASVALPMGGEVVLSAEAAAEPEPTYQWQKDGQPLAGETGPTLKLTAASPGGEYAVGISNRVGTIMAKTSVVVGGVVAMQPTAAGAGAPVGSAGAGAAGTAAAGTNAVAGTAAPSTTPGTAAQSGQATPMAGNKAAPQTTPAQNSSLVSAETGEPAANGGSVASAPSRSSGCSVSPQPTSSAAYWWILPVLLACFRRSMRRRNTSCVRAPTSLSPVHDQSRSDRFGRRGRNAGRWISQTRLSGNARLA